MKVSCFVGSVLVAILLLGCSDDQSQPHVEVPSALVDRQLFFADPSQFQGRISPDGQWLSWLAPSNGVMNVWVAPAEDPSAAVAVTREKERGVPVHYWAPAWPCHARLMRVSLRPPSTATLPPPATCSVGAWASRASATAL